MNYEAIAERLTNKMKRVQEATDILKDARYDLEKEKEAIIRELVSQSAFELLTINRPKLMLLLGRSGGILGGDCDD